MTLDSLPDDTIDESQRNREFEIEDDRVVIDTDWHQEMDPETFMEVFNSLVNKHRQLTRQVQQMQSQINHILDESEDEMKLLHAIDERQDQSTEDRRLQTNSVSAGAIQKYTKLQQMQEQKENSQNELDDIYDDIEDMEPIAEEVVENSEELEMPNNLELVHEEVEES